MLGFKYKVSEEMKKVDKDNKYLLIVFTMSIICIFVVLGTI